MVKLRVWKTLQKGRHNHWMLNGCQRVVTPGDHNEVYLVSLKRMRWICLFEAICGYRIRILKNGWWEFTPVNPER